jgi:hypothetical protein
VTKIRSESSGVSYTDARKKVPERSSGLRPSEKGFRNGVPAKKITLTLSLIMYGHIISLLGWAGLVARVK